jgi:hypothetical protein
MDPDKWGPYGWKMIHAVSHISGLSISQYRKWLIATSAILPCRKCRKNFKRHLNSGRCDHARSSSMLSICLHSEVSADLGKTSNKKYNESDLPTPSIQNILQPSFWLSVANNKTLRKKGALSTWFKETETILSIAKHTKAVDSIIQLQKGLYGPILKHTTEAIRQRHLIKAVRKMLHSSGIKELPTQGSILRMRSSTSRRRPSHSKAFTKRRHAEYRKHRSGTRRRQRAVSRRTSSG